MVASRSSGSSAAGPTSCSSTCPCHASWLNPIEIYFSIVSRKALTPCHFASLDELSERVLGFQAEFRKTATPFNWTFTRHDLNVLLDRLDQRGRLAPAA